jgi:hypothetical protein
MMLSYTPIIIIGESRNWLHFDQAMSCLAYGILESESTWMYPFF